MIALTRAETGIPITERRHTAVFTRTTARAELKLTHLPRRSRSRKRLGDPVESAAQRRYLSAESMALILSAGWTEENSLEQQHDQEVAELNAA